MAKSTKRKAERDGRIFELSTLVAGEFSLQEVLERLAEAAVKITGVKACSIRLLDEEAGELRMRSTYGLSEEYRNKGVVSKEDAVIKEAFSGKAVVVDDMRFDERVRYRDAAVKEGLVSQLTVAMHFRGEGIGVLRLYSPRPKHFGIEDISLARAVASQCAVAITNARLYAKALEGARISEQMRLAGVIQRRMIPEKAPEVSGLDISATYIPCFDVGGDLYDFLRINERCIAVVIADVIGKGIPASIMTSMFRGAVRAYTDGPDHGRSIGTIIDKLNKMACRECRDGEFISLHYSVIDMEQMSVTYCNCGHEPTLLLRDGEVQELDKGGLVLGVRCEAEYQVEKLELKSSDCLLYYTDGLIDAINFDGELWGRERMLKAGQKFLSEPAEQMVRNILCYRRRFVGLSRQIDDTSIIVMKVKPSDEY